MRSVSAFRGAALRRVFALALIAICAGVAVSLGRAQTAGPALTRVPFKGSAFPLEGEAAVVGTPTLARVFENLTFSKPLFLQAVPGTNPEMLAVLEQDGRVIVFPNDPTTRTSKVLIDIRSRIGQGGANERGLLGLAFDKDFTQNGFFYLYYTGPGGSNFMNFIDRYQVTNLPQLTTSPMTRCQVFTLVHPQSNHNSGTLLVDRDGFLYFPIGDGGGANDTGNGHSPEGNGQDITMNPLGSILRLKVDTSNPSTCAYSTAGNPFSNAAGNADQGGDREIFALGVRNMWRSSFDRKTGDFWAGDVGQKAKEEVDFLSRAQIDAVIAKQAPAPNFGWPCREGSIAGPNMTAASCKEKLIEPVFDFNSGNQGSVIGGYLYRGKALPQFEGQYIFGDFGDQAIRVLDPSKPGAGGRLPDRKLFSTTGTGGRPWSLGEDRDGEIYVLFGSSNQIRKITVADATTAAAAPAAPAAPAAATGLASGKVPKMLSETGLFQNAAGFVLAPGVVPYEVNSKLFSDNLEKDRFLAIPGNGKIKFDAMGRFDFPVGTVLLKQFNEGERRIETRFLVRGNDQWRGYTYEWLPDQRDAVLSAEDLRLVQLPSGSMYELPSRSDCQACHNRGTSAQPLQIIGFQARQLNFPIQYDKDANSGGTGVMDNQLRALNAAGFFSQDVGDPARLSLFPSTPTPPADLAALSNADVNRRARSFLESNCAPCHRPGGNTPSPIDLQFDTPNAKMLIFQEPPGEGDVDGANLVIDAGKPQNSVLLKRMMRVGRAKQGMPPLSHQQLDKNGIALITEWVSRIDRAGNPLPEGQKAPAR